MTAVRLLILVVVGFAVRMVAGGTYTFLVNPASSSAAPTGNGSNTFDGTMKGNYDAVTNPGGTRTIQGGGSTAPPRNDNVAFTGSDTMSGSAATHPAGAFTLTLDTGGLTAMMSNVSVDLLNGAQPPLTLNATILFATFQTIAPNSVFPGGSPVPVPLGNVVLTAMDMINDGPAVGTLTPAGGGSYNISVTGSFTFTFLATWQGSGFTLVPATGQMTFSGTVTPAGATATATLSAAINATGQQTQPEPGPSNAPFDLATVLPPGQTAHMLVTMTFLTGGLTLSGNMTLAADGVAACEGDADGDGDVDQDDLDLVLFYFGTAQPPGTNGDIDGNGQVDQDDIDLALFNFGCPV